MATIPEYHPQNVVPAEQIQEVEIPELRIYGHSNFFYWWPVWITGYALAALTRFGGEQVQFGDRWEWVHPNQNLGLIFTMVFFFVILFTNVTLRGLQSIVAILFIVLAAVLLAYFGLWGSIFAWLPNLSIHMNMGFYVFFSTLIFGAWVLSVFVFDRLSYWTIRPGQITHERVIGGAEKSFDTHGMVFEKVREDLFRHWILGLGSGDLRISTMGAKREELHVHNVLFVDHKVTCIQQMIAMRPDQFSAPALG